MSVMRLYCFVHLVSNHDLEEIAKELDDLGYVLSRQFGHNQTFEDYWLMKYKLALMRVLPDFITDHSFYEFGAGVQRFGKTHFAAGWRRAEGERTQ